MCTVIFLPLHSATVLISNRDESPLRLKAMKPELQFSAGVDFICPIDPVGTGTWVGVNTYGTSIVLLNGAFKTHTRSEFGYRKSRGVIVFDLLGSNNVFVEWMKYFLENIEPFTLVVHTGKELYELVWDGVAKHQIEHPVDRPAIWSSSTLYSPEAKEIKRKYFLEQVKQGTESWDDMVEKLLMFKDDQNGFFINRSANLRTLSTTVIDIKNGAANLEYIDHDASVRYHNFLPVKYPESDLINKFS